jgi:hypothetical protein
MKDFKKFLEEITIKGSEGIPGEKDKNEPGYLKDVEARASRNLGLAGADPRQLFPRIMGLVQKSMRLIAGKEEQLEKIAYDVIMNNYGSLFDDNIKLDIKFAKSGRQVKDFMDDCDGETCQMPQVRKFEDPEVRKEVDKRKIANAITQGEAKNTKHILNMPEVKEKIIELFGEKDGEEAFRIWNEITSIADKLDWIIPIEQKSHMMEHAPEGMAGACKVEWKPKEIDDIKPFEVGKEEKEEEEQEEESSNEFEITVKAIGIDFPMLLHEAVKGIYELITAKGIPGNEEIAKKVLMNTDTFEDEAEDFRYGPEIAADLRDFINENSSVDEFPNIREHVFGKMIELQAEHFLRLMKGILMKTSEARTEVDNLVVAVITELKEYELGVALPSEEIIAKSTSSTEETEEIDYSTMSKSDLHSEADDALDAGDIERFKKISQYLANESVAVYMKEFERINESKNRRK